MSLAFFHGDPFGVLIIPLLIALVLGVFIFIATAVLFYRFRHSKLVALYLTLPYLITIVVLAVLFAVSATDSLLFFISFLSSFILTLPWSALGRAGLQSAFNPSLSRSEILAVFLIGAGLNALIVYGLGVMVRRLFK